MAFGEKEGSLFVKRLDDGLFFGLNYVVAFKFDVRWHYDNCVIDAMIKIWIQNRHIYSSL